MKNSGRWFASPIVKELEVPLSLLLLACAAFMKPVTLPQSVYSLQVSIDISQSMDVEDVLSGNSTLSRLALSKLLATELLESLPCGSSIGWSVFTGRRTLTLLTPLDVCLHYSSLLAALNEIDGSMRWSNGSAIGKALHQSIRAADTMDYQPGIVFLTDGHEAPPLEPGQRGMPNTDKFNTSGVIVGIGGDQPVPIPKTNQTGEKVGYWSADEVVQLTDDVTGSSHEELSQRHDEHLQTLARLANVTYMPFSHIETIVEDTLEASTSQSQPAPRDIRWIPALMALMLLMWRFSPRIVATSERR